MRRSITCIKKTILCCLLFALAVAGYAQNHRTQSGKTPEGTARELPTRSFLLFFHPGNSLVDSEYRNNRETLHWLERLLSDSLRAGCIDSLTLRSFTSPQGNRLYNRGLSRERLTALKKHLTRAYPKFNAGPAQYLAEGENWQKLHRMIIRDTLLPFREEMLQIIERNGYTDRCKVILRKLENGRPYRTIYKQLYPLCDVSVITVRMKPGNLQAWINPAFGTSSSEEQQERRDTTNTCNGTVYSKPDPITSAASTAGAFSAASSFAVSSAAVFTAVPSSARRPLFSVKTNLLFDAALMPNIELEVPIGKRWSLNGEYMFPWWLLKEDKYSLEILAGGLEARCWLGRRKNSRHPEGRDVLAGHFFGLYAGGGKYDLQWEERGYQGEFFIAAGVSYGYSARIARHLRLEFNIGVGLLRTDYRHYRAKDHYQTLLWQENGNYTWLGPTKVKISLAWLLTRKAKKGGKR